MEEKFEYWQAEVNDQWCFHLVSPDGKVIVHSEGYTNEEKCLNGINEAIRYAETAEIAKLSGHNAGLKSF